jgi:hypothetical protein
MVVVDILIQFYYCDLDWICSLFGGLQDLENHPTIAIHEG